MFARFFHRPLDSVLTTSGAVLLCIILWCSTTQAADPTEVQGLIATGVHFTGDARERVSTAGLELLASCSASGTASEKDWAEASHGKCRLHFSFVKPRFVTVDKSKKIEVAEMVITFPLSAGRVWVRSGDKYTWFAMYRPERCKPIQELLKEAMADE